MRTADQYCEMYSQAIVDFVDKSNAEIAVREKDNGAEINKYNRYVIFGIRLAGAILHDELEKQLRQTEPVGKDGKQ